MNKALIKNKELSKMLYELNSAPKIYSPSIYWQNINQDHIQRLLNNGMKNFKLSINRQYFGWGVSEFRHQLRPILSELLRGNVQPFIKSKLMREAKYVSTTDQFAKLGASLLNSSKVLFFKVKYVWLKPLNKLEFIMKFIYKIYIAYLYDYVSRIDNFKLLKKFPEPRFGGPLLVNYRRQFISQDLCNSVHEFYSISEKININKNNFLEVAELGAGYGRLAYVFLKALPNINYCIIDIPPAIYVAQEYLKEIFPKERIFLFRHFKDFQEIEKDFKRARIKFLMPHQIEYLPKEYFDLMINISSLHEMSRDQIKNYLIRIDYLTKSYFYSKQWKKSHATDNDFIREEEYPIPSKWKKIFDRTHSIQDLFFEALYKTR